MARTISEIYDAIMLEKQEMSELTTLQPDIDDAQTMLTELNSSSKVAVWRLWVWLMSVALWIHEKLWDEFKAEVDAIVEAAIPGTARWYREQVLAYQHGDELVPVGDKYQYATVDTSKQIVKQCSVTETGGILKIKVAKAGNATLTTLELEGLSGYLALIKFAGTALNVTSYAADILALDIDVYVNTTLLAASDGESTAEGGSYPVVDAIEAFVSALPWDGTLYLSALMDAIQAVPGVVDVVINGASASKYSPESFSPIDRKYSTFAGHIVYDNNASTINYHADV